MKKLSIYIILIWSLYFVFAPQVYAQTNQQNNTSDPFEWLKNIFTRGFSQAEDLGNYLLHQIIVFLIYLARVIYVIVGLVGIILWASGLQPHKGKRFVIGAVILAIVTEVLSKILL